MKKSRFFNPLFLVLFSFLVYAGSVNAAVVLTNGSVTHDVGNGLTQFKFTLTSNVNGETFDYLTFDGDSGASWGSNPISVYESHSWAPIEIQPVEFYVGLLDTPIVFDGINGIEFDFIFSGLASVIDGVWEISASTDINSLNNVLDNESLAIGQAGTVTITNPVPIPAAVWLFGSALAGLGFVTGKRNSMKTG